MVAELGRPSFVTRLSLGLSSGAIVHELLLADFGVEGFR